VYGSSAGRALYGMGDYQSRSGYAGGYYAAGGFFSGLKKLATSKLGQVGLGLLSKAVPVMGPSLAAGVNLLAGKRPSLGDFAIPGYSSVMKGGVLGTKLGSPLKGLLGGGKAGVKFSAMGGAGKPKRGARRSIRVEAPRRRKRRSPARRSSRRTSKRRRGDWGDDGGRDKRGHFLNERGGHANFRKRRRRRGGGGGRVSFTTKDGRRVSFTARRGDDE
jgi:hypothetical protein